MDRLILKTECFCHLHQMFQPLFAAGRRGDYGDAEQLGQFVEIDVNSPFFGFIAKIDTEDQIVGQILNLKNQIQIPLQTGGVADGDDRICIAVADKVPGHLFLSGVRQKGVGAWQVNKDIAAVMEDTAALGTGDRFAGPVACVLAQTGQIIKDCAFSDIGISGQGYYEITVRIFFDLEFGDRIHKILLIKNKPAKFCCDALRTGLYKKMRLFYTYVPDGGKVLKIRMKVEKDKRADTRNVNAIAFRKCDCYSEDKVM